MEPTYSAREGSSPANPSTRTELESLDRDSLIARAEGAGVLRARVLTRPELVDEILVRQNFDPDTSRRMRGLLGRARDLLARLVERGLNLPDAADRLRGAPAPAPKRVGPAVPTVTLAEIYATQGHTKKAVDTLHQVLEREPDHAAAKSLLEKLASPSYAPKTAPLPEETDDERVGYEVVAEGETTKPSEPARMLDADPLPPKYDVDECVAILVDPATIYVYWEVRDDTLAAIQKREGQGQLTLRVLVIVPTWDGPRTYTRDIDVGVSFGDWFVRDLPNDAIIRAAIGWLTPQGAFLSAAHSQTAHPAPRDRAAAFAEQLARWTPAGTAPLGDGAADVEAARIARALTRSEARRIAEERARQGESAFGAVRIRTIGGSERLVETVASS
ncbi:MAG TPA: DUF4912 domain-containing protein [Polyangiaceae bacterium]|jgi:hypothetical protein